MSQTPSPGGWPDPPTTPSPGWSEPPTTPSPGGWSDPPTSPMPSDAPSSGGWPDPTSPTATPETLPAYQPPAATPAYPVYPGGAYGPPAAAPPGYGYPQYGYGSAPKTNGLAVAAMVISIVSAVGLCAYGIGGLLGVVGAVMGHVSRRQIRERGEAGDGMALAGVIVGWIAFGIGIVVVAFFVIVFTLAIGYGETF